MVTSYNAQCASQPYIVVDFNVAGHYAWHYRLSQRANIDHCVGCRGNSLCQRIVQDQHSLMLISRQSHNIGVFKYSHQQLVYAEHLSVDVDTLKLNYLFTTNQLVAYMTDCSCATVPIYPTAILLYLYFITTSICITSVHLKHVTHTMEPRVSHQHPSMNPCKHYLNKGLQ